MSQDLETALRADLALLELEAELIRRAFDLYSRGFVPKVLSASQMSALGELLRQAQSVETAVAAVSKWLGAQMRKLEARCKRTGRSESWFSPARGEDPQATLGATLDQYLAQESYLPDEPSEDLDRLAALRRFWARFHGLYRYHHEIGKPIKLHDPDQETPADSLPQPPSDDPGGSDP